MKRLKEMNKLIFHDNLIKTINEICPEKSIDEKNMRFRIIPVSKEGKAYGGMDEIMRLVLLSEKNIGNRLLSIDETVQLVTSFSPCVPIWINVAFNREENGIIIFDFETSVTVRKPSLLMNVETGHAPFKAVIK